MNLITSQFNQVLQIIADGWNEGNASKAANCFSADAIYIEPPDKQVYHGREALYDFFGGDEGTDLPMHMT